MLHQLYCIYDSATGIYNQPFYTRSKGEALRTVMDTLEDKNCPLYKYAADYTLFELGTFDDTTGMYHTKEPKSVSCLLEFKKSNLEEVVS